MKKLTIYNNAKTYFYPDGSEAKPERVSAEFAMVNIAELKSVIETDITGIMFYTTPVPLAMMAADKGLNPDDFTSDEELLQAIEDILNAPQPEPSNEPSAEERIASAMEFQNLINM